MQSFCDNDSYFVPRPSYLVPRTSYLLSPMVQIFFKEFNGFLNSLIAYIVIGVFLTAIGLLMWVFPDTSVLEYGYADMDTLFLLGPYVFIFLVPAITMRSFAEEKKAGTIELLLTKPVDDWDIIMGKFLANFFLVMFALYRRCYIIFRFQRWEIHLATLMLRVSSDPT